MTVSAALALAGGPAAAEPRAISAAERRAVELLVAYCEGGATALAEAFDEASPWRLLPPAEVAGELEARLGPPCAGEWQLQTSLDERTAMVSVEWDSGIDDALSFEFTAGTAPRLVLVRSLTEVGGTDAPPPAASGATAPALLPVVLGAGAAALAMLAAPRVRRPRSGRAALCSALAGALVFSTFAACRRTGERGQGTTGETNIGAQPRLAALLPLRRALATDTPRSFPVEDAGARPLPAEELPRTAARVLPAGEVTAGTTAAAVAAIWRAQWALLHEGAEAARPLLDQLPASAPNAAVELLRARVAFLLGDEDGVFAGYVSATALLPHHDGVRHEAAVALHTLGYEERAERMLEELAQRGSRQAGVYTTLAELALLDGSAERAEQLLERALRLRPIERRRLLDNRVLAPLVRPGSRLLPLLRLDQAAEPAWEPERPPLGTADLGGARATLEGSTLRVELRRGATSSGSLVVPGGAELARPDSERVPVATAERARIDRLLGDRRGLMARAAAPGALSRARLREDLELATEALAERRQWRELVELTEPLAAEIGRIETEVLQLRALALEQLDRREESIGLLARLVKHVLTHERRDPGLLYQLGDLLAQAGHYDTAVRLIERASAQLPALYAGDRVRQIRIEQRLQASFEQEESRHFVVRYPRGKGALVRHVVAILESERDRLLPRFPATADAPRLEVQLMSFEDFSQLYGGGVEVVGVYDGRIRVPLADVRAYPPELVAILTHELAHAMIAQASGNQAPKWLHEGLAQLVEMQEYRLNPMKDYLGSGRYLAFPLVEAVLQGFPNAALVGTAYDEALWVACYLEAVHGRRGIHQLLAAFRDGLPTNQALALVVGEGEVEFDRALRTWWLEQAPAQWRSEVREYALRSESPAAAPPRPALQLRRWWQAPP